MDAYANKRDKRRTNMVQRLHQLNESFDSERDLHYSEMLHTLQNSLYTLHMGTNPEFLELLADLEEERDNKLLELYLWHNYQTEQSERLCSEDSHAAEMEYEQTLQFVKTKLRTLLESHKKHLTEDKAVLEIGSDASFFLNCANPVVSTRSLTAAERQPLRRREMLDDSSRLSGSEARSRRVRTNQSDADTGNDLDTIIKEVETPSVRATSKTFQGVNKLKAEEAFSDINLIRTEYMKLHEKLA